MNTLSASESRALTIGEHGGAVAVGTRETFADVDNTSRRRKNSPTSVLPIVSHCTVESPMMLKTKDRRARIRIPNSLIRYISLSKLHHKKPSLQPSSSSESPNRPRQDNEAGLIDDESTEKSSTQSHQGQEDGEEEITDDEKAAAVSQNTLLQSSSNDKKRNKVVSFGSVYIREYDITIGDNVPTQGIPIGLKWKYTEKGQTSLHMYESHRPTRRTRIEMYLPAQMREDMLLATHARSDVRMGKQKADETRKLRIATQKRMRFVYAMESFGRILRTCAAQKLRLRSI